MDNISERLKAIAENELRIYNAGKFATLTDSKYMHPTVSGEIISVNDVFPVEHRLGIKATTKNLLPNPTVHKYNYGTDYRKFNNTNMAILEAGTYAISGSIVPTIQFWDVDTKTQFLIGDIVSESSTEGYFVAWEGYALAAQSESVKCGTFTTNKQAIITLCGSQEITNCQIEIGSTATDYVPHISNLPNVEVSRYGRNLIDFETVANEAVAKYPTTCEIVEFEGRRCLKISDTTSIIFNIPVGVIKSFQFDSYNIGHGKSIFSLRKSNGSGAWIPAYTAGAGWGTKYAHGGGLTIDYIELYVDNPDPITIYIDIDSFIGVCEHYSDETIKYYEPYKKPQTVTPNADGTVEGLTSLSPNMTIFTNTDGVTVDCQYYRDIDTYIDNLTTAEAEV